MTEPQPVSLLRWAFWGAVAGFTLYVGRVVIEGPSQPNIPMRHWGAAHIGEAVGATTVGVVIALLVAGIKRWAIRRYRTN